MKQGTAVTYLHGDNLGSTTVTSGATTSSQTYYSYGAVRTTTGTLPTDYTFTGQRVDSYINLMEMGVRWYDPAIGRFIQPDTIIPNWYNPQSLNRYSYAFNNPIRYTDPTGHDPLDTTWRTSFKEKYGRDPTPEDVAVRLFSIAYSSEYKESSFYDENGAYIEGSMEKVFRDDRPADRSWTNVPDALDKLAATYKPGEEEKFTRDVGTLYAGLKNRFEELDAGAAISYEHNPARVWVYVSKGNLPENLIDGDPDANIHHWAWGVTMGAEYGPGGSIINTVREIVTFRGNVSNTAADIEMGNTGAAYGANLRLMGLESTHMRRVWNEYMLNDW